LICALAAHVGVISTGLGWLRSRFWSLRWTLSRVSVSRLVGRGRGLRGHRLSITGRVGLRRHCATRRRLVFTCFGTCFGLLVSRSFCWLGRRISLRWLGFGSRVFRRSVCNSVAGNVCSIGVRRRGFVGCCFSRRRRRGIAGFFSVFVSNGIRFLLGRRRRGSLWLCRRCSLGSVRSGRSLLGLRSRRCFCRWRRFIDLHRTDRSEIRCDRGWRKAAVIGISKEQIGDPDDQEYRNDRDRQHANVLGLQGLRQRTETGLFLTH